MRVLLITPLFPFPRHPMIGKDRCDLVKNMMNEGHDITVVTLSNDKESSQNETWGDLKIHRMPSMAVPQIEYLIPNAFALVQLIKKARAHEPPSLLPRTIFRLISFQDYLEEHGL